MATKFKFNQKALSFTVFAILTGAQFSSQAQANDQGTLIINGQISATTCVLNMGDAGSTGSGSKTLNLGTFTTTTANAATASGGSIGAAQTVLFSVKNADGSPCNFGTGNTKWDIGIAIPASQFTTVGTTTALLSGGAAANNAQNVGVKLSTTAGAAPTAGLTEVKFTAGVAPYGTLLSAPTSVNPSVNPTDLIALTAQMIRTNATAVTAGAFSATIPLNVWYK